uniref:amino acid adenylation domain-containing protein n=1 Tax=Ascidiimonas meishanensis TaxID=3128903 RepID=UPI0030EE9682
MISTDNNWQAVSILEKLSLRSNEDKKAIRFLNDNTEEIGNISYQELNTKVEALALYLTTKLSVGERALLLYPSSIEFIICFLACLKAGIIAVPVNAPSSRRRLDRLENVLIDSDSKYILTIPSLYNKVSKWMNANEEFAEVPVLLTDAVLKQENTQAQFPEVYADNIAFLQYTSGSTGVPKGVMVTHGNIAHNCTLIRNLHGLNENTVHVGWLPMFHDMGLIGNILSTIYVGGTLISMAPVSFVKKPVNWLKAITTYKGTITGAPNFAYDLCINNISEEEFDVIDLSSCKVFFCGAEPIKAKTLADFATRYVSKGLKANYIKPCYGMAETTLIVSSVNKECYNAISENNKNNKHTFILNKEESYPFNKGEKVFVTGGEVLENMQVIIVDPNTKKECEERKEGEVWIKGGSVAKGYWNKSRLTEKTFNASCTDLTGNIAEGYLRTGDIGFLSEGELYISGRLKEMMIFNGENYFPQDIEAVVQELSDDFVLNAGAVFSINKEGKEELIIAQEIKRTSLKTYNAKTLYEKIAREVYELFELKAYDILFLQPASIPKTSSGKTQRTLCKKRYENNNFKGIVGRLQDSLKVSEDKNLQLEGRAKEIAAFIKQEVAGVLQIPAGELLDNSSFWKYGLDSIKIIQCTQTLENYLNAELSHQLFWEFPTIQSLAIHLSKNEKTFAPKKQVLLPEINMDHSNKYEPFPLNEIQQAYLVGRSDMYDLGNIGCHTYLEFMQQELDPARFEMALRAVIKRHDMLRMVINEEGKQQIIEEVPAYKIQLVDLTKSDNNQIIESINEIRGRMSHKVYSGKEWPLFEVAVTCLPDNKFCIHLSLDLLILDVWSIVLFSKEWQKIYEAPETKLPELEVGFRDYVLAAEQIKTTSQYENAMKYWQNRLKDFPLAPALPLMNDPSTISVPQFRRLDYRLPKAKWEALKKQAQEHGITPSIVLCTLYSYVLSKWSSKPKFTINTTLFNRLPLHAQVNELLGDFTTLILLSVDFSKSQTFVDQGNAIQAQLWSDMEHRLVNGIEVQRELGKIEGANAARMPIVFTSSLGLNEDSDTNGILEWMGERVYGISQTPQVWLDYQIFEEKGDLIFNWDFVEGLFYPGMIEAMFEGFCDMLNNLATEPLKWNQELPVLLSQEQPHILEAYNATKAAFEKIPLHGGFFQSVTKYPHKEALIAANRRMSYKELGAYAIQISKQITLLNVPAETQIAVLIEKGWEQVASVLGILHAQVAYLPLDIDLPEERIAYLLEATAAPLVLTNAASKKRLEFIDNHKLLVVDELEVDINEPICYDKKAYELDKLAYTIFTSGSTGLPKGVMIDHTGAVNTIQDINEKFAVNSTDKVFGISALNFDLSVYDIFGTLAAGATLVIPNEVERRDPEAWLRWIHKEQITIWNSVPALVSLLAEEAVNKNIGNLPSLRLVMMSGDWIPLALPEKLKKLNPAADIISLGGATEVSIWSIYYPIKKIALDWVSIPYGYPLKNQTCYVLNTALEPCPYHVIGDIYIGGIGVAMGYFKDLEKTNASFIVHPKTGERLYRTGDLGRFKPEGFIEFMGRADNQVKINGYRIELGEIETHLQQHPEIKDCTVVALQNEGSNSYLHAFTVENYYDLDIKTLITKDLLKENSRRIEFKLKNKGLRKIDKPINTVILPSSFNQDSGKISNTSNSDRFTKETLGTLLSALKAYEVKGEILPKYFYPSAGSLYPVQCYILVPKNKIEGIEEGAYYYNRELHALEQLKKEVLSDEIQMSFISDLKAIRPMYGTLAPLFSCREAGHMYQLLTEVSNNLSLELEANKSDEILKNCFELSEDHIVCQHFSLSFETSKNKEFDTIVFSNSLAENQVYRKFLHDKVKEESLVNLLNDTFSELNFMPENLDVMVYIKPDTLEEGYGNWFEYDNLSKCFNKAFKRVSLDPVIYPLDYKAVYRSAGFGIFLIQKNRPEKEKIKDFDTTQIIQIGFVMQSLFNEAAKYNIGLCNVGLIDERLLFDQLKLSHHENLVYSCLGGAIKAENKTEFIGNDQPDSENLSKELKAYLAGRIPKYMVPAAFTQLQEIPLTANGKVDKKLLNAYKIEVKESKDYIAPSGEMEMQLANFFGTLLQIEKIGRYDDFFDLGGNSIQAIRLLTDIRGTFGVEISVRTIFENPTIALLSDHLQILEKSQVSIITKKERPDLIPLSYAQERLWFIDYLGGSIHYHFPYALRIHGSLNIHAFTAAIKKVVERHESLRTVFNENNGDIYQEVMDASRFEIGYENRIFKDEDALKEYVFELSAIPFGLESDYLMRINLIATGNQEYIMVLIMHHIAADGWSVPIFANELELYYNAYVREESFELPALPVQYADYSLWQRNQLSEEVLEEKLRWWSSHLEGIEPLELPTDYARPALQSTSGARYDFSLDGEVLEGLKSLSQKNESTLFMTLLSLYNVLLYKYTGQDDICVGIASANREQAEITSLIGFFVNAIAIRTRLDETASFDALLTSVKKVTLDSYAYQDVPFERIVDRAVTSRDRSQAPLFQTMLTFQNTDQVTEINLEGMDIDFIKLPITTSKFDLSFDVAEVGDNLVIGIEYCTDLFKASTIERMAVHFKTLVDSVIHDSTQPLHQITLLSESEQVFLLEGFN